MTMMSMWILQSSEPDDDPLTFRLSAGTIKTIGRAPRADFIVDRALVSRIHCRLTAGTEKVEVEDLASTNGTYVNDKRVERAQLASGDRLRVGRIELRVASRYLSVAVHFTRSFRNGFVVRSRPMVVSGPWPGCTIASSPNPNSTVRIELISVA